MLFLFFTYFTVSLALKTTFYLHHFCKIICSSSSDKMEDIEPWDCMVFAISILVDNSSESHMGYSTSANLDPSRTSITIPHMPHKNVLMSRNTYTLSQEVFICLLVPNNWRYWNRSMFSKEKSFYKQHVSTFHSEAVTSCRWYHRLENISCHFYYYFFILIWRTSSRQSWLCPEVSVNPTTF